MGFPRSTPVRRGWGGRLLYPGTSGAPPPGTSSPRVAWRLAAPGPAIAGNRPSSDLSITRHHRRFTFVRPSSLPLVCSSLMAKGPLDLNAQLHTPPLPATHVSAGTGPGHWPEVQPVNFPSLGCPYSTGATSCRTLVVLVLRHALNLRPSRLLPPSRSRAGDPEWWESGFGALFTVRVIGGCLAGEGGGFDEEYPS